MLDNSAAKAVKLAVISRGCVCYDGQIKPGEPIVFPKKELPEGISQFIAIDSAGAVFGIKSVFSPYGKESVKATITAHAEFSDSIRLNICLPSQISAHMSVAITKGHDNKTPSIIPQILLSQDVRGGVADADRFFANGYNAAAVDSLLHRSVCDRYCVPSILAGIVVGLVTVLFAAYSPAKKAAKVSPLAAVSGNANDLEPARNAANTQLLKIDTALGIYHAKANRKNLFLMTSSFALSIILFLSFSVTVEFMQHTLTPLQPWTADLSIISPDNACAIDKALLDDLKENPVVDLAYGRKFAYEVPSVTNGIEKKMDLISYEQYQFDWAKDYLLEGSLESVQTDLGTGLIVYNSQNTIQIGDTVSLNTNGQSKEIQIVGMLSDCPFYSAAGVGTIICSEDTFEQITGESKYTVIDVQLVKGTTDEDVYVIRQMVDSSFTFADERMGNSSTMGTYYCFWLFIYGFLVLIAMITIFNIINSISMSVSARLKQYGAFRAIGVSMGQLSKMIVAEAFTYTIIGGVVGTVLGLFCNKLLFGMLISYRWGDAWTPPLPEVAVILLIVISSVILAVHGPIKRIRNMSIVDTISAQ